MSTAPSPDDVLYGVPAIAQAFKLADRQVYHLKAEHGLPTFKVGRTVCARRGAVATWLAEREAAGRASTQGETGAGDPNGASDV